MMPGMRPLARLAVLSVTATTLLFAVGATPAAAGPTALDVGPPDAGGAIAVTGLGTMEQKLERFVEYMQRVGLEDPGVGQLRDLIQRELRVRKGPIVRQLGFNPDGAIAAWLVTRPRPDVVISADVANPKAVIALLVKAEEEDQWVPDGEKPRKAKVQRRKLPGGAMEVHIALPDRSGMTVRFQGGVMLMSQKTEALDAMRLAGGSRPAVFDNLDVEDDKLSVAGFLAPALIAEATGESGDGLEMIEKIQGHMTLGAAGMETRGRIELSAETEPFLGVARPGPAGAKARKVMLGLAGDGTTGWFRWSVDVQGAYALARQMVGPMVAEATKELKTELKLDLEKDIVNVFTGDLMISCREGIADCVFVVGTTDSKRAVHAVEVLMKKIQYEEHDVVFTTTAVETDGGQMFETIASEQDTKKGRPVRGAERQDHVRFFWGARDGALMIGSTREALESGLTRADAAATAVPSMLIDGAGFADDAVAASYQLGTELSSLLRQVMPIVRSVLPSTGEPGMAARALDTFIALQDRIVDGGSVMRANGRVFSFEGQARMLPIEGEPGFDAAIAKRFEEALKLRYIGRVRSSNEALLKIADASPDSVWGLKARTYALAGDGFPGALLGLIGGGASWLTMGVAGAFEEKMAVSAPVAIPAASDCAALENLACYGQSPNQAACNVARNGSEPDCAREFRALVGGP